MAQYREVEKVIKEYNPKLDVIYLEPHEFQDLSSTEIRENK